MTVLGKGIAVDELREDVRRHEGPLLNMHAPLCDAFTALARSVGVGVLATGLGGDELTTDYGYSTDLLRTGRLVQFLRTVPGQPSRGDSPLAASCLSC